MRKLHSLALLGATAIFAGGVAITPTLAQVSQQSSQPTTINQQKTNSQSTPTTTPVGSDTVTSPYTAGNTTTYQRADGTVVQQRADGTTTKAHKSTAAAQPLTPANYVTYAQTADLFEVEASKIAVQRAQNKDVREYAERVVADYSTSSAKLSAAARQAGVTPGTPVLTAKQQAKLNDLRAASDPAFDKLYINTQLEAQERELRLHNSYARSGDQVVLKSTSSELAPVTRKHLTDARQISAQLGHEG